MITGILNHLNKLRVSSSSGHVQIICSPHLLLRGESFAMCCLESSTGGLPAESTVLQSCAEHRQCQTCPCRVGSCPCTFRGSSGDNMPCMCYNVTYALAITKEQVWWDFVVCAITDTWGAPRSQCFRPSGPGVSAERNQYILPVFFPQLYCAGHLFSRKAQTANTVWAIQNS